MNAREQAQLRYLTDAAFDLRGTPAGEVLCGAIVDFARSVQSHRRWYRLLQEQADDRERRLEVLKRTAA